MRSHPGCVRINRSLLPPHHIIEKTLFRVPPVLHHSLLSSTTTTTTTSTSTNAAAMPPQTTVSAATKPKKKPGSSSIFSLKCGCKDAKSVSISDSRSDGRSDRAADPAAAAAASLSGRHRPPATPSARPETSSGDTITFTTATTSTSHDDDDDDDESPTFSGLLHQLSELERSVAAWELRRGSSSRWTSAGAAGGTEGEGDEEKARRRAHVTGYDKARGKAAGLDGKVGQQRGPRHQGPVRHRRSQSEGGRVLGKVGESVAVVKQTEDPLGDFRRSMLQMIVEKEILSREELQELLCSFLTLNAPSHHALIIRAFADIWRDVFSGYGRGVAADPPIPHPIYRHRLPVYGRMKRQHYY